MICSAWMHVLFLFATISAYWALRVRGVRRLERLEFIADVSLRHGHGADDCHLPVHHLRDQHLSGNARAGATLGLPRSSQW